MAGVAALGGHADGVTDAGVYPAGAVVPRCEGLRGWRSRAVPFQRPVRAPHVAAIWGFRRPIGGRDEPVWLKQHNQTPAA